MNLNHCPNEAADGGNGEQLPENLLDGLGFLDEQEDTVTGPHLMGPVAGLAGTLFSAVPDATSSTCSNGMPDDGGGKQSGTSTGAAR